jgi:cytochrome c-type protein NapC
MANYDSGVDLIRGRSTFLMILIFLAGVIGAIVFSTALSYTNTTEFCVSCHSMTFNMEEYKETIHFKNPSGVRAGCPDCHVPQTLGPTLLAKLVASRDILHEILGTIDTKEKFEAKRWILANRVWDKMRATDSRECRSCHGFEVMDLEEQQKIAGKRHISGQEEGKTCIDCHKGVAHHEPDEPDDEPEKEIVAEGD